MVWVGNHCTPVVCFSAPALKVLAGQSFKPSLSTRHREAISVKESRSVYCVNAKKAEWTSQRLSCPDTRLLLYCLMKHSWNIWRCPNELLLSGTPTSPAILNISTGETKSALEKRGTGVWRKLPGPEFSKILKSKFWLKLKILSQSHCSCWWLKFNRTLKYFWEFQAGCHSWQQ